MNNMDEIIEMFRKSVIQSQERYNTLVSIILNSLDKSRFSDEIQIKNDTSIIGYLQAVEPEKYNNMILAINKKEEESKHIPTTE